MPFVNQRIGSSQPLVSLDSHTEPSLHLSQPLLQTKQPAPDVFFNSKSQRNSNKQSRFQQKVKFIFYLYCQNHNLMFAKLPSKLFINVLLNYIITIQGGVKYTPLLRFICCFPPIAQIQKVKYVSIPLQFYSKHKTICSGKQRETTR